MLTGLKIKNFVLVDNVDIEFHEGLTVLSGETGAGKSIIIEAVCLALGKRANSNLVRAETDKAEITATFEITPDSPACSLLKEFDYEHEECVIRRVIFHGGKSRAYCNENPVTTGFLKNLSGHLVDVHAQQQSQQVLESQYQRQLLDCYTDSKRNNDAVNNIYGQWKRLKEELSFLESNKGKSHRMELLEYQLKELDSLSLDSLELATIEDRHKNLTFSENNQQVYSEIQNILDNEQNGALQALQRAFNALKKVKSQDKDNLNTTLEQASELIKEVFRESERAQETNQVDSQQLRETEARLSELHELARKHECSIKELGTIHDALNAERKEIEAESEKTQNIKKQILAIESDYKKEAECLTAKRKSGLAKMASDITSRLATLGIPEVKFDIQLERRPEIEPIKNGHENVRFVIATNPGQELADLASVVSGGELSRTSLAIQEVISSKLKIPTLIFDEVDTGIGGSTATVVGQKLREVSGNCQVLCITHSPQVASAGDHHYLINKKTKKKNSFVEIRYLSLEAKESEISRMLGATTPKGTALEHARELIRSFKAAT